MSTEDWLKREVESLSKKIYKNIYDDILKSLVKKIKFCKLHPDAVTPTRATDGSVGWDLTMTEGECLTSPTVQFVRLHTGIAVEIPKGYVGLLFPRSSCYKKRQQLANSVGVIDSDYRGEVCFVYRTIDLCSVNEAYGGGIPRDEQSKREKRLIDALPHWLAFLDQYVAPDLDRTQRMIVPPWQNPEIMQIIFDDTEDGAVHRMIQTLLEEQSELDGQAMTAQTWISKMENCSEISGDVLRLCDTPERFGRRISTLAERFPELYERSRSSGSSSSGKRTRLIKISKEVEKAET